MSSKVELILRAALFEVGKCAFIADLKKGSELFFTLSKIASE